MASGDGSGGGSSGRRSVQEILGMFNKKKDSPVIPRTSADAAAAAAPAAVSGPKPGRTKLANAGPVSSGNGSGTSSRQDAASWLPSRSSAGTGSSNATSNTGSSRSATTAAADWLPESPSKGTTGKSTGGTGPGSGPLSSIRSPDSRPIAAGPTAAALGSMSPLRKFGAAAKQEQEQEQQEQERLRKAALAAASAAAKASAGGTRAGPSFFLGRSAARTPPTSAPGTPSRVFSAPAVKPATAAAAAAVAPAAPAAPAATTPTAAVEAEQPRKLGVKKWPPEPEEREPEDPVKALEKQLEKANVEIAFLKVRNAEQAAQLKKLQAAAAFNDIAAGAAARRRSRSSFQQQQQPPLTPQMLPPASESAAATRWRIAREGGLRVSVGGGSAGQSLPSSPRADSTREDKGFDSPGSVWSVDEGECRQCGRLRDQLEAVEAERVALEEHRTAREVELISARARIVRLEQTLASTPGHGPRRSLRFPQPSSTDMSSSSSSSSSSSWFRSRGMHPHLSAGRQDSSRQHGEEALEDEEQHHKHHMTEEEEGEGEGGAAGPVVVTVRPWTDPQVTELRHALGSAMGAYRSTLESLKKAEAALQGRADAVLEQAVSASFRVSSAQQRFSEGVV